MILLHVPLIVVLRTATVCISKTDGLPVVLSPFWLSSHTFWLMPFCAELQRKGGQAGLGVLLSCCFTAGLAAR